MPAANDVVGLITADGVFKDGAEGGVAERDVYIRDADRGEADD